MEAKKSAIDDSGMSLCLARPKPDFATTDFVIPSNITDKDALIKGGLLSMPPELTIQIIEEMDDDVDRLCLGLSCRRLLQVVKQLGIRPPCMKSSRQARNIPQDNKLAFSLMKRVYPLDAAGNPRADAALCQSCFKWINMNHSAVVPSGPGSMTVLSQVVSYRDRSTFRLAGIFFECAACVVHDSTPPSERLRRQRIYKMLAVLEPSSFCSVAVWTSRVNMHDGSEVDA